MATSRAGTAVWKRLVIRRRHADRHTSHCPRCGQLLNWEQSLQPTSVEIDHIVPHAQGGKDVFDNTTILCRHCNQSAGAKRPRLATRRTTQTIEPTTSEW